VLGSTPSSPDPLSGVVPWDEDGSTLCQPGTAGGRIDTRHPRLTPAPRAAAPLPVIALATSECYAAEFIGMAGPLTVQ